MNIEIIPALEIDYYVNDKRYLIIDLRSEEDFKKSHIKRAKNIPFDKLSKAIRFLPRGKKFILYCERGGSSLAAAKELNRLGFTCKSVSGGILSYRGKYLEKGDVRTAN